MIEVLLYVLLFMVCFPPTIYMSVKLGTYGFFRARRLYEIELQGEKFDATHQANQGQG